MKNLLKLIAISSIIASCSSEDLSQEDKNEIAIITCNIMAETREFNSAQTLKELNIAREKIGQKRFLGSSEDIKQSFDMNMCEELVLYSDDEYVKYRDKKINDDLIKRSNYLSYDKWYEEFNSNDDEISEQILNLEQYFKFSDIAQEIILEDDAELNILLNKMKTLVSEKEQVLKIPIQSFMSNETKLNNYTKLQDELIQDYRKRGSINGLIKELNDTISYYHNKVDKSFEERNEGTLSYQDYESLCYIFSDQNKNNFSFSKYKKPSKSYLNPYHWKHVFDSSREKKIEEICNFKVTDKRVAFIDGNQLRENN